MLKVLVSILLLLGYTSSNLIIPGPLENPEKLEQPLLFLEGLDAGLDKRLIQTRAGEEYRIPRTVLPLEYNIDLTLDDSSFSANGPNIFKGKTTITISVTIDLPSFQLHAHRLNIISATLKSTASDTEIPISQNFTSDPITDILVIYPQTAGTNISAGIYILDFDYEGDLLTGSFAMNGFYKSSYINENNVTEYLGTTQFESTNARKALPCFDEPFFKAEYTLSFTYPAGYNVIANTPFDGLETDVDGGARKFQKFQKTPKMSTYLIAFVVSKFNCDSGVNLQGNIPYRVCSRPESGADRKLAVDIGPKVMRYLEDFTGIPYSSTGIGKMDQVAIPDFAAGAMENWGLVTYRETGLLWDEIESSNGYKQSASNVISHEFAHMWFGNLVTLDWWSDVFLNEGFARYFQYFATASVETTWELEKQFVVDQVHSVLLQDSAATSAALSVTVNTPAEISNNFGTISYNKGASVIRMFIHAMGENQFQLAIKKYLEDNQFKNTRPSDLYDALDTYFQPNADLGSNRLADVMRTWIEMPGYPVLHVQKDGNDVLITQERFQMTGASPTTWFVPITYTTSNNTNDFLNTQPKRWLTPSASLRIQNALSNSSDWIVLNNQQTSYYRVNYTADMFDEISKTLLEDINSIHVLNRAQIVDDLFNFARASKLGYVRLFNLIEFLKEDTELYPWQAAFNGFSFVTVRVGDQRLRNLLSSYILGLMNNLYDSVPITRENHLNHIYTLKQVMAVRWACRLDKADCVQHSKDIYTSYRQSIDGTRPSKNLRSIIYCTALKHSDNPQLDWDFLWQQYLDTKLSTEKVTILGALGCTRDEALLNRYLNITTLPNSQIRQQDASSAFSAVYSNFGGESVALQFIIDNLDQVRAHYNNDEASVGTLIRTIATYFTTQQQVDTLSLWINTTALSPTLKLHADSALETGKANVFWINAFEDILDTYFQTQDSQPEPGASNMIHSSFTVLFVSGIVLGVLRVRF